MKIEQLVFAGVSIMWALGTTTYLRGAIAKVAILTLGLGVMFFGPKVFGQDWYQEGYIGGIILGDFMGLVFGHGEAHSEITNRDSEDIAE